MLIDTAQTANFYVSVINNDVRFGPFKSRELAEAAISQLGLKPGAARIVTENQTSNQALFG